MQDVRRLLVIGSNNEYGREALKGILAYCRSHGAWDIDLVADSSSEGVKRANASIREWKPCGIIANITAARVEELIVNSGQPIVKVGAGCGGEAQMLRVATDNLAVGKMAAHHLLENGLRNFGFVFRTGNIVTRTRCQGFQEEVGRAGFNTHVLDNPDTVQTPVPWNQRHEILERWIASLKTGTGIMCVYDELGREVARICRELGMRVPQDISIVGAGNLEMTCLASDPSLSSVDLNRERAGYEAARLLDDLVEGRIATPSQPLMVAPRTVVVRASSDMVTVADPDTAEALRFIREHACWSTEVKDILERVPVSRKTLERRFKELIGRTPREEIMRVCIEQAKRMLADTELSVLAIARKCGFSERGNFRASFRRKTGLTPRDYRCRFQEERVARAFRPAAEGGN